MSELYKTDSNCCDWIHDKASLGNVRSYYVQKNLKRWKNKENYNYYKQRRLKAFSAQWQAPWTGDRKVCSSMPSKIKEIEMKKHKNII